WVRTMAAGGVVWAAAAKPPKASSGSSQRMSESVARRDRHAGLASRRRDPAVNGNSVAAAAGCQRSDALESKGERDSAGWGGGGGGDPGRGGSGGAGAWRQAAGPGGDPGRA